MSTIRVLVVDDHPIVRAGICKLLDKAPEIEVVGEAGSGEEALQLVKDLNPDVILLDVEMPGKSGIEVAQQLRREKTNIHILALSAHNSQQYVQGLLESGVSGYLVKEDAQVDIIDALRGVARGEEGWLSRQIKARMVYWTQTGQKARQVLTGRELEVVQQLMAGKTNQEIGYSLGISAKTVEKHLQTICQKLGVSSRTEAAVWAAREELNEKV
jgi:DNA-binding NarL/FixJ family response regulator